MEAITLTEPIGVDDIRKQIIGSDQRLESSIQWLMPWKMSETIFRLNDPQQVHFLTEPDYVKQQLQLHGIQWASKATFLREYKVFVFQTHALLTYAAEKKVILVGKPQQISRAFYHVSPERQKNKEIKKVHELAIRTLYSLGLDYGFVTCGIAAGKRALVVSIDVRPKLSVSELSAISRELVKYRNDVVQQSANSVIKLGADPEFVVQTKQGSLLIASDYFPLRGKVGCDAIWIGQNRKHKPLVELRPDPTPDPRTLTLRIYEGLLYVAKKINHVSSKWLAGNQPVTGFPLGGHIHFSGIKPNFKLLRALDNYLSLPLIVAEDERGSNRRPKYGYLGDYRLQHHGGFEYRTPPSWLISPVLTKGIFALAKCIVRNYRHLRYQPLADPDMQKAYYQGDKQKIRPWVDILWSDLYGFTEYQQNKQYLDNYFRYIQSGKRWNESTDFRKAWKIPPYHRGK